MTPNHRDGPGIPCPYTTPCRGRECGTRGRAHQKLLLSAITGLLAASSIFGQQTAQSQRTEGARELFYLAAQRKDDLPPIRTAAASKSRIASAPRPVPQAAALHLGLRYNLALVNPDSGASQEVDPERVLRTGECFALDFESNRSGYLYVLAKQTSGSWQPLLPSPEMADESNIIDPSKKVRVPARYCFEVHDPPGTETLFVVLSRDPRDFYELYQGIKSQWSAPAAPPPARRSSPLQYADAGGVNSAVARMAQQFGTRDIAIRKVDRPASPEEPPHSVYVVNSSDRPASSVVTQIEIRHR